MITRARRKKEVLEGKGEVRVLGAKRGPPVLRGEDGPEEK